jgi:hypothetical protein
MLPFRNQRTDVQWGALAFVTHKGDALHRALIDTDPASHTLLPVQNGVPIYRDRLEWAGLGAISACTANLFIYPGYVS